jgi:hypothetical protein
MERNPFLMNIGSRESGGDYGARSKTSSAGGKYQFTDSTWLSAVRKARPDLRNATDRELLKLKTDRSKEGQAIQEQTANYYLQSEVVPSLTRQGIEPTEGNVYLAWFAGPAGAAKALKSAPDTPISKILSEGAIRANRNVKLGDKPFSEFTQSDLVTWAGGRGSPRASVEGEPQQEQVAESTADVLEETVPATMGRSAPDRSGRDIQNLARYYESMNQRQAAPLLGIPNLMAARQQEESRQDGIASLFPYS